MYKHLVKWFCACAAGVAGLVLAFDAGVTNCKEAKELSDKEATEELKAGNLVWVVDADGKKHRVENEPMTDGEE